MTKREMLISVVMIGCSFLACWLGYRHGLRSYHPGKTYHVYGDLVLTQPNQYVTASKIDGDLKIEGMGLHDITVQSDTFGNCAYFNGENLFAMFPSLLDKPDDELSKRGD